MIPVQLKLKNFMSYGVMEEPIDFTPIHVVCLTGDNGNGKSSLLEAIMWAIWGKARATTTDDLIRFGQTEMQVEFVFDLGHDRYRILRARSSRGRGRSTLELQIFNEKQGKFVSLTQRNMRETQDKINTILRMDYETFINSAFILQGKADSFTVKNPTERKNILADILNLGIYDVLESKSRKKRRDAELNSHNLSLSLKELESELSHKSKYEDENRKLKQELNRLQQKLESKEKELEKLRENQTKLRTKRDRVNEYDDELNQLRREHTALSEELETIKAKLQKYEEIILTKDEILTNYAKLEEARERENQWIVKQEAYQQLKDELVKVEQILGQQRHQLELEIEKVKVHIETMEQRIKDDQEILDERKEIEAGIRKLERMKKQNQTLLNKQQKEHDLIQQIAEVEREVDEKRHQVELEKKSIEDKIAAMKQDVSEISTLDEEYQQIKKTMADLDKKSDKLLELKEEGITKKAEIEQLQHRNIVIDKLIEELHEKMNLMDHAEAQCPLCSAELDAEGRQHIIDQFQSEHQELTTEKEKNDVEIEKLEKRLASLRKRYKTLENALSDKDHIQKRAAEIELLLSQHNEVNQELPKWREKLVEIEETLKKHTYAQADEEKMEKLKARLARNKYDKDKHVDVRKSIEELSVWTHKKGLLDAAITEVEEIEAELPHHKKELEDKSEVLEGEGFAQENRQKLHEIKTKIDVLSYDPEAHVAERKLVQELTVFERKKMELEQADQVLREVREDLRTKQKQLVDKENKSVEMRKTRDALAKEIRDLPLIDDKVRALDKELISFRREEAVTRTSLGRNEERLEHLRQLEEQRKEKQRMLKQEQELKGVYNDLVYAFSKKGIQALIIERVLPELEEEANLILRRLSDHRMNVKFESQKAQKSGNITETLEIRVTDESSTRSYELFSGGEAFRINFAIRIALSKLLARRAGAKLQTLIIDEGFGTQDIQGRDRLVEVIGAIDQEFEKIFIITHIPELKDAFPTRIEVTKEEGIGSMATVV